MCFPSPPRKRQHTNKIDSRPLPGQSRTVVYVYWFLSPPKNAPQGIMFTIISCQRVEPLKILGVLSVKRSLSEWPLVLSPIVGTRTAHMSKTKVERKSETGRIRFRRVRFQTPSSVGFFALTEFWGENSVSSSQPIICVTKRTHRVFRRTHRVCPTTQWGSVSSLFRNSTLETVFRPFPRKQKGGSVKGRFWCVCVCVPSSRVLGSREIKHHSFLLAGQHCRERLFAGHYGTGEHLPTPFFGNCPV